MVYIYFAVQSVSDLIIWATDILAVNLAKWLCMPYFVTGLTYQAHFTVYEACAISQSCFKFNASFDKCNRVGFRWKVVGEMTVWLGSSVVVFARSAKGPGFEPQFFTCYINILGPGKSLNVDNWGTYSPKRGTFCIT